MRVTALVLACLAGCTGPTPRDVIEDGEKTEYISALASRQAANCVARNGQGIGNPYAATITARAEPETFEVVFNAPSVPQAGAIMVIRTRPLAKGSLITFYVSERVSADGGENWREKLGQGC